MSALPGEFDPKRPLPKRLGVETASRIGAECPPNGGDVFALVGPDAPASALFGIGARELSKPEALGVARVFWPDVMVYEGWVFLADGFSEAAFTLWRDSDYFKSHGMRGICSLINHRHVGDVLRPLGSVVHEQSLAHLGYVIGSCWETRIRRAFPDREFRFECGEEIWFWEGAP